MLEREVENPVNNYAKRRGIVSRKMNGAGYRGWPDRLYITPKGRVFWIEFKAPGNWLSPVQEVVVEILLNNNAVIYFCDSVEYGKKIIDSELRGKTCVGRLISTKKEQFSLL
jgi:hypothetical protein